MLCDVTKSRSGFVRLLCCLFHSVKFCCTVLLILLSTNILWLVNLLLKLVELHCCKFCTNEHFLLSLCHH